ncbi:MAG: bifunctional N(6)-L-threonylcarbamoyladenine synthase/serine/threonine protein kinase [Candidatus Thermoplasmatota archaeon]
MPVLGIEGTAHTIGVGIVEESEPGRCRVLANERAMVRPPPPAPGEAALGIHPRDAAHHHAEHGPDLLRRALAKAKLEPEDLDAVAFSRGPGLGPCLRVAATMGRALSLRAGVPLVGVNHCVAHLEVGRGMTDATDPMLLYVSGGNTQVLAFARGRYRVFGETLDVGLGNALDKFARENGFPFPGGPEVERLAATAPRDPLHPLPYTVKGMDLSFAGLATASQRLVSDGVPLAEACHAFQEHAFAAVVEVAERALAHTGRDELVLGGGVACNTRLQAMARAMCAERGASFHAPPRDVLVDNGAMIGWLGLQQARVGDTIAVEASAILPHQRTDQVDVTWRPHAEPPHRGDARRGAEAVIVPGPHLGRDAVRKVRAPRPYRHPALDVRLRAERTRDEAALLVTARAAGVPVPVLYDADRTATTLTMERIPGRTLREALADDDAATAARRLHALGQAVARLHDGGATHGDLTAGNVLVPDGAGPGGLIVIDFGLGQSTRESEPRGVDLHLVEEALEAGDARSAALFAAFLDGYGAGPARAEALRRLDDIRARGRYR